MATTKAKRHIHKYYRLELAGQSIWACGISTCTHHMPAHMTPLLNGRASICWACGDDMILNQQNMKRDKPKCDDCDGLADINEYLESKGAINPITGK